MKLVFLELKDFEISQPSRSYLSLFLEIKDLTFAPL